MQCLVWFTYVHATVASFHHCPLVFDSLTIFDLPTFLLQALNLIRAVQTVMKVPLIALNVMTMVMEVLFG